MSPDELDLRTAPGGRSVLGIVGFDKLPPFDSPPVPITASMTPPLGAAAEVCEVWRVGGTLADPFSSLSERSGRIQYRYCGDYLFGSVTVAESAGDGTASAALVQATKRVYRDIFGVLEQTRRRHLIRVWNYLPDINRETDGEERYRHFNFARQAAFRHVGRSTVGTVPAACALGTRPGSPISIYFLASSRPPTMIENPRQTSAYFYPPQFGASSPTFSRACLLRESPGTDLFVSGTASIVGHETVHPGDATAQTRETLANIEALLGEANRIVGSARYSLDNLKFKVYVRHAADFPAVQRALSAIVHAATPVVYLQADVCREDLLVEIEATGASDF